MSCTNSNNQKNIIGKWEAEIQEKLENGDWIANDIVLFKLSLIPNIFRHTKSIEFNDNGEMLLDVSPIDNNLVYYYFDDRNSKLYLSLSHKITKLSEIDNEVFSFSVVFFSSSHIALINSLDTKNRLNLKKY